MRRVSPGSGVVVWMGGACALLIGCGLLGGTGKAGRTAGVGSGPEESAAIGEEGCGRPRLIVQITVDQLRADLLQRSAARFGEGGFRRFLEQGVRYVDAHYRHAVTETAPGHATLATGADPRVHGIVANDWYDASSQRVVYNAEDAQSPLVGVDADAEGRSPAQLRVPTLSDQLDAASAGVARSIAVSIKDRGAIYTAGHRGKAFWFDKASGRFITSAYYADELPAWVRQFNEEKAWLPFVDQAWTLLRPAEQYVQAQRDGRSFEGGAAGWDARFPHPYGSAEDPAFFGRLTLSPAGDALTLALVRKLLAAEPLGVREDVTDYLAVSFSSTDYVGHTWGPNSLESEDNLLRLDAVLAELLTLLQETVGLEHALVVLSADHGAAEAPEERRAQGLEAVRHDMRTFDFARVEARVAELTGSQAKLLGEVRAPYVWLDMAALERAGLEAPAVRSAFARAFEEDASVHRVFTLEELQGQLPTSEPLLERARRSYMPGRSGDLHLVPEPYTLLSLYPQSEQLTASHGTPWPYDTHVPILALGAGVPSRTVARPVGPHAIAPTLALRAGAAIPPGAVGELLDELLTCR